MQTPDMRPDGERLTVYYDGSCPLCRTEIRHYASQKGAERLCFVDVTDMDGDLGEDLDRNSALARFHVRRADGTLLSGAAGFTAIWQMLPRWRWAAKLSRIPGVPVLLELAYRAFLPLRPWIAHRIGSRLEGRKAPKE